MAAFPTRRNLLLLLLLGFVLGLCDQVLCQTRRCRYHEKPHRRKYEKYGLVNGSEQLCYFTDCCYGFYKILEDGELQLETLACYLQYQICSLGCERRQKNFLVCVCDGDLCNNHTSWSPKEEKPVPLKISNDFHILFTGCFMALLVLCVALASLKIIYKKTKKPCSGMDPLCETNKPPDISDIKLLKVMSSGSFATVWEGRYQGAPVAVKVFSPSCRRSFTAEREVLQLPLLVHPNIVTFIGSGTIGENKILLLEYVAQGSLHSFLTLNSSSWTTSLTLSLSLSQGLAFLHKQGAHKPVIAHGDLSSSNVLVKSDGSCVLCDFGCSTVLHQHRPGNFRRTETEGGTGTLRYMSPEVLDGCVMLRTSWRLQADVYSLALVLWEIWTRCYDLFGGSAPPHLLPYEADLGPVLTLENLLHLVLRSQQRPALPQTWKQHPQGSCVVELLENCWDTDPEARLSASCVVDRLSSLQSESNSSALSQ